MKLVVRLLAVVFILSSCQTSKQELTISGLDRSDFSTIVDGKNVELYVLRNKNGLEMTVTNYGAKVVSLMVPGRDGELADVVTGFSSIEDYLSSETYFGAVIGRYANRIANARFNLDGVEYTLAANNGPNCLHAGLKGFNAVVWDAKQVDEQVLELHYTSSHLEEGFPGNLSVKMIYKLTDDNEFFIEYTATTDQPTVVNLTHHSFFNLAGEGHPTVNDHMLTLNASYYTPVDSVLIPLGILDAVEGTPLDFRTPTRIGDRLDVEFPQLILGSGYDHNFVVDRHAEGLAHAATITDPSSGRVMEVWTTQPGIQFYGGNFMDGVAIGKNGHNYPRRSAFCLETQHFPDSPNQPAFPSTVLRPDDTYHHVCVYKFKVD